MADAIKAVCLCLVYHLLGSGIRNGWGEGIGLREKEGCCGLPKCGAEFFETVFLLSVLFDRKRNWKGQGGLHEEEGKATVLLLTEAWGFGDGV